ncbi:MAG: SDR family oxidoreductase [Acidimicrobiia bacterium]|nr:SDR family oxidoreductase [Acidimicrobiia bacterium]MYG59471.1 SDR family oxidoreductase [Acidimicrobiia bacterium]MYJ31555.1 SDR family oxidoreductase [Acidimicrobiia bacterium]
MRPERHLHGRRHPVGNRPHPLDELVRMIRSAPDDALPLCRIPPRLAVPLMMRDSTSRPTRRRITGSAGMLGIVLGRSRLLQSDRVQWERALVTGASAGIGRAMAVRLADAGVDLVLVARRGDRLEELAEDLRADGAGPEVEVLEADLCDLDGLAAVEKRVVAEDAPIDLLVNNAGLGYEGPFHSQDPIEVSETINVNMVALVRLSHAALGSMTARDRGQVILVSSMASLQGMPMTALYAATKAFITSFGEGLYEEHKGTGVTVTTVLPGLTRTEFHQRGRWNLDKWPSVGWQSAEEVAAEALAAAARSRPEMVTGRINRVLAVLSGVSPRRIRRTLIGRAARRAWPEGL